MFVPPPAVQSPHQHSYRAIDSEPHTLPITLTTVRTILMPAIEGETSGGRDETTDGCSDWSIRPNPSHLGWSQGWFPTEQ